MAAWEAAPQQLQAGAQLEPVGSDDDKVASGAIAKLVEHIDDRVDGHLSYEVRERSQACRAHETGGCLVSVALA